MITFSILNKTKYYRLCLFEECPESCKKAEKVLRDVFAERTDKQTDISTL